MFELLMRLAAAADIGVNAVKETVGRGIVLPDGALGQLGALMAVAFVLHEVLRAVRIVGRAMVKCWRRR